MGFLLPKYHGDPPRGRTENLLIKSQALFVQIEAKPEPSKGHCFSDPSPEAVDKLKPPRQRPFCCPIFGSDVVSQKI